MKQQKWSSLAEHVANKHDSCMHGELDGERQWLREGSRALLLLLLLFREVVESQFLMKDISKLSPVHQTYGLEVFHSVVNTFAPKNTHFFYPAMMARLCVATLHFNENGRRHQATTGAGAAQWYVSYPKGKKGQTAVVKPHKTLMVQLCRRAEDKPGGTSATIHFLSLTSSCVPINKEELVAMRWSMFAI
uniref:Uncharacterized protein n=1 Tax=Magallana gigas TaxID=29159 RepID=A0A8W8LRH6_MAGGI